MENDEGYGKGKRMSAERMQEFYTTTCCYCAHSTQHSAYESERIQKA